MRESSNQPAKGQEKEQTCFCSARWKCSLVTRVEGPVGPVPCPGTRTEEGEQGSGKRLKQRLQGSEKARRERQVLLRRLLSRDLREKAMESLGG